MPIPDLVAACARVIEDKKGFDIVILDVAHLTLFDAFVVASCEHPRQARAIALELERTLASKGVRVRGVEGDAKSGWTVLDAGTFVVHLFVPRVRAYYDLEMLWGDAPRHVWAPAQAPAAAG